jgi:hypothetical protein
MQKKFFLIRILNIKSHNMVENIGNILLHDSKREKVVPSGAAGQLLSGVYHLNGL